MRLLHGLVVRYVIALGLLLLASCDRADTAFGETVSQIPRDSAPTPNPEVQVPLVTCVDSVIDEVELAEVVAVVPPGRRPAGTAPQDRDWLPTRVSGVIPTRSGFAAIDPVAGQLHLLSADFLQKRALRISGPSSGTQPTVEALASSAGGDTVWILLGTPAAIQGYDLSGRLVRTVQIARSGQDLAVDDKGRFFVARQVIPDPSTNDTSDSRIAVTIYPPTGGTGRPLVRVDSVGAGSRRFILPGPNDVRLSSGGSRVAVFFPAGGIVDIYEGEKLVASGSTCMPRDLAASYEKQFRASSGKGSGSQSWLPLVNDVWISGSGSFSTVTSVRDAQGRQHVDHFSRTGAALGSTVIRPGRLQLMAQVAFAGSQSRVTSVSTAGSIIVHSVGP